MKKQILLLIGVMAVAVFIPVVFADISTPTVTNVYFEQDGEPYDGYVEYTVNCYGYEAWPGDDWFGNEPEEGSYTPELVYSYSASCPEYGCVIYEDYYMNYRHVDYCDLEGEFEDGESFYISNFGDWPYTGSCEYTDEESRECDTYFEIPSGFFSDVSEDHVNYDAIAYIKEQGIINGYDDGTYRPDNTINRAEFVKIIVGSVDHIEIGCDGEIFSDFGVDEWYYEYVCIAKSAGIISGYPDGTFKPANEINFAEVAKVIVNGFGYEILESDVWYEPYIEVLQDADAIPLSITAPDQYVTRGEVAEIIYRLMISE